MTPRHVKLENGLNIYIRIFGKADNPPLILLHGWPVNGDLWRHCLASFSKGYRVFVPDLPGHGRSDMPLNVDYDLDFFVRFVKDLLDLGSSTQNQFKCRGVGPD